MSFTADEMAFLRSLPLDEAAPRQYVWVNPADRSQWEFRETNAHDFPPDERGMVCLGAVQDAIFWITAHDLGTTNYVRPPNHSVFVTRRSVWPSPRKLQRVV
jgi:hypothetical protein